MGGCASIPKAMRGDAGAAAPPEPPKEETTVVASVPEVAKDKAANDEVTVEEEEKKTEGGDEKNKEEEKEGDNGKRQSLGFLLTQSEEAKEEDQLSKIEKTSETETAPSLKVNSEEQESGELFGSDEKIAYVAPVAHATNDEKETEAKEEKV
ncbi:hypothetical protein U1Q18_035384 [Sarracenia purpurea var. burkii]